MKQKILLGVLVITNILSLYFVFRLYARLEDQEELAEEFAIESQRQTEIALEQSRISLENEIEAQRMQAIAEEQHEKFIECQERCK